MTQFHIWSSTSCASQLLRYQEARLSAASFSLLQLDIVHKHCCKPPTNAYTYKPLEYGGFTEYLTILQQFTAYDNSVIMLQNSHLQYNIRISEGGNIPLKVSIAFQNMSCFHFILQNRAESVARCVSLFSMHTATHTCAIIQMSNSHKLAKCRSCRKQKRGPELKCLQRRKDTPTPVTDGKYTFSAQPPCHPLSPQTRPTLHYSSLNNLVLICSILVCM